MKHYSLGLFSLSMLLVGFSCPTLAHHSMSMYDLDRQITVKGTVSNFAWSNPHAQVQFDVQDEKGGVVTDVHP